MVTKKKISPGHIWTTLYKILIAVLLKCPAILNVIPRRLVHISWYFKGLYWLYISGAAVSRTASPRKWKHYNISERFEIFTSRYALTAPKTWNFMFQYRLVYMYNCWIICRLGSGKTESSEVEKFPSPFAMQLAMYTFQFHVTVHHIMINENTSLMQQLSIYFT